MKKEKTQIGYDHYREAQYKRQATDIQKAFLAYQMALGEQGLEFYSDVEKSLEEVAKSVQIKSSREVKQEAILSLIGILPERPRQAWNTCHRAITEMGVKWEDIDADGKVNEKVYASLLEGCILYASTPKALALAESLFKVKEASEEFYALMQTNGFNRPNMNAVGNAFQYLLIPEGEGGLKINPSQFQMYTK